MPRELPDSPDLEALRKQPKRLLRAARAADPEALRRLRVVPRLDGFDDARLAAEAVLADAQHAIAREYGSESWPKLKQHVEDLLPLAAHVARFLELVRRGDGARALRLLARQPAIAGAGLHAACAALDADALARLLAADATRAMAPDAAGWPPLVYVCASPHAAGEDSDARAVRCATLLLDAGADVNGYVIWDGDGKSRLAALYYACVANRVEVVALLLARGAEPNDHESVFHSAELDHRECLELLLRHGADLSGRDGQFDNTPLRFLAGYRPAQPGAAAALGGVRWLLEHGADPNVRNLRDGETALHAAALSGNVEQARLLLEHGVDVTLARNDGRTAYALAVRSGHTEIAGLLAERGGATGPLPDVDEFLGACLRADEPAARALLAADPELIHRFGVHEHSRFAQAAGEGRRDAVRLMLKLGFDLARESEWGGTPLHWAAWHGNADVVRELLAHGAPVDVRDSRYGSSPVAWGAHGSKHCRQADDDYCAVVELLLDAGSAREPAFNKWGEPPENLCADRVAALLVQRGFAPRLRASE
jgi:ankyrin repeat protein